MSAESIASFRSKVAGSGALQIHLVEAFKSGPNAVTALGAAHGCHFDALDLQAATAGNDLTDFELGLISGGGWFSKNGKPSSTTASPMSAQGLDDSVGDTSASAYDGFTT